MKLQDARTGEVVQVRKRPVAFSFFPTFQRNRREGVHSILFITDPWNIIRHRTETISNDIAKQQAFAFLAQARDFYTAAQNSDVSAAKPLLLYYSFLNLAKCFVVNKHGTALRIVRHGLSEKLPTTSGAIHGHVDIDITKNPNVSAFVMFAQALGVSLPTPVAQKTHVQMRSQDFLAQILPGHRVFCQAENFKERFISLESIDYMHDTAQKEIWLRVRAYADDFTRHGYPLTGLSRYLSDQFIWRNVKCEVSLNGRRIIEAETKKTLPYTQRPSQSIGPLSNQARSRLWRSVSAYPPYRKYYVYQPLQGQVILNQILTIYIATFYFGSITRYKPEQFDSILKSAIGPFVFEFFANQPSQFLYLLASEFIEQEVARAAIA